MREKRFALNNLKVIDIIKRIFFPSDIKCIFCDDEIEEENRYCSCGSCSPNFNTKFCLRCGKAIDNQANYCIDCKGVNNNSFDEARAPFVFSGSVKSVVHKLKYGDGRFMARYMAEYMADSYYQSGWGVDVVTFVPMDVKRRKSRGYNQAELIAQALSDIIQKPCIELLKKTKSIKNLASMNRKQRAQAIKGTIVALDVDIKGKKILLIDDVMTTSATANECSAALRKRKTDKIYALTFATSRSKPLLY